MARHALRCHHAFRPQIKQYRGLPFKAKARGIFNATGLNEGIVFVSLWEPRLYRGMHFGCNEANLTKQ